MAAMVTGSFHAPITAILLIFDLTKGDYRILLPVSLCVAASALTLWRKGGASVYSVDPVPSSE